MSTVTMPPEIESALSEGALLQRALLDYIETVLATLQRRPPDERLWLLQLWTEVLRGNEDAAAIEKRGRP